jgi:hypothetical protein
MAITRTPIIDDDGTGTTGTIINNLWKQEFYDQIDGVVVPITPATFTDIPYNQSNFNATSGTFFVEAADIVLNRWARLGPAHVFYEFYLGSASILNAAAGQLIIQNLPFTARTNQVVRLGWATISGAFFDGFLQTQGTTAIHLLPVTILSGGTWAINANATTLACATVLETI